MKKIISVIMLVLFGANTLYAAPFYCMSSSSIFAELNQCNTSCGELKCREMEPVSSSTPCDTAKYIGFVAVGGKTFALTKASVKHDTTEPLAKISNAVENDIIKNMLKSYGVTEAFIGAHDPAKSSDYNIADIERFVWRDNSKLSWSNFRNGEPNNNYDPSSIGVAAIYGEHWVTVSQDGFWQDIGEGKNIPAVVEFRGALACVSGKEKQGSSASTLCADGTSNCYICPGTNGKVGSCTQGVVFDTANTALLCSEGKKACVRGEKVTIIQKEMVKEGPFPDAYIKGMDHNDYVTDTGGGILTVEESPVYHYYIANNGDGTVDIYVERFVIHDETLVCYGEGCGSGNNYRIYFPPLQLNLTLIREPNIKIVSAKLIIEPSGVNKEINSGGSADMRGGRILKYKYIAQVEESTFKTVYTCPDTGRPCIESGGGYYCSSIDCTKAGNAFEQEGSEEGSNDADNNGSVDEDGNCLGRLVIFPGQDRRCRRPGLQTKSFECCNVMTLADSQKPDITITSEQLMLIAYLLGSPFIALLLMNTGLEFDVCSGKERQMGVNIGLDQGRYIGEYCSERWSGSKLCVQNKKTYCIFDSDFSRAFNEAGMDLLGKSWGTPEKPNCGGFSPEELTKLSAMGISDHPKLREFGEKLGKEFADKMNDQMQKSFSSGTKSIQDSVTEQLK